jgi:putative ABC transport system permease protein
MNFWQDVRFGARTLRRSPAYTITSVVTLALGIGVTTATYSVCDAMLWKPVPIPSLSRLAMVLRRLPDDPNNWGSLTPADFDDIRRNNSQFEDLTAWQYGMANIVGPDGEPDRVRQILVTANFFDVLHLRPALGRSFVTGEDEPGRERVAILSDGLWKRKFGADPAIVGKTLRLDDADLQIVGVMPPKVEFPMASELWTPLALTPAQRNSRELASLVAIGLLKPGRRPDQAGAELAAISATLARQYPQTNRNRLFIAWSAHDFLIGTYTKQYNLMMFASVLFVLLIACGNVANLQFARALSRTREVAVRTAVGAARRRIIVQLVTESVLVSLAGAALGLLVAGWSLVAIKAGMPPEVERYVLGWKEIALDGRALAFTILAAVVTGILAALAPAWQSSRLNVPLALREGGRGSTAGRDHHRVRDLLVAAEIALSTVLLVGASLMVRGVSTMAHADRSYEPESLLTFQLALSEARYHEPYRQAAFYDQVLAKLRAIHGAQAVAAVSSVPHSDHEYWLPITIEGRPNQTGDAPYAQIQPASANYLRTLHVPLLAGRMLAEADGPQAQPVAVITDGMTRRFWPGQPPPIGKRIAIGAEDAHPRWFTIVGVTHDVVDNIFDRGPILMVFVPYPQFPRPQMDFAVRCAAGDPMRLARAAIAAVRSVDPQQPVSQVFTLDVLARHEATGMLYVAYVMGLFGLLALTLSAIGVYGVMSFLVRRQTHEIGIRIALGARKGVVLAMLFRRGLFMAVAGAGVGLLVAYVMAGRLALLIWGVPATDTATFTAVPLVLLAAASLAIYLPARRAIAIDPMVALRED